ncbi:transcriptional repressor CTCF-like [Monomorium pharaonis]|uniref:transcriptional repressor CTCF-like n=1 Tax=Monomorium pharaonis TaxID=307658 RepID=UPI00063F216E|nr:transcriptional repressor CTCF-like [Monomorium pharaonis]
MTIFRDISAICLNLCFEVESYWRTLNLIFRSLQKEEIMLGSSNWNLRGDANNYDSTYYKRYTCSYCKRVYMPKSLLKRHMQYCCKSNTRNTTSFSCTFCPYKSIYKANMERHVRNVHNTGALKFRCELCNFRSNYSFCVRRHVKTFHRTDETQK